MHSQWLTIYGLIIFGFSCSKPTQVLVHIGNNRVDSISGLDACDDFRTKALVFDPNQPVTVLVHGCKASSARYRILAQVFEALGHEQRHVDIEEDPRVIQAQIRAGHALVVGMEQAPPYQLIEVLQHQGYINYPAPNSVEAFHQLLARLY